MKQEVEFIKLSPTQNMTILVKTEYATDKHTHIAAKMMSYDHVHAEQVGFIQKATNDKALAKLCMAGGEFCGNACMALACLLVSEQPHLEEVILETTGTEELVRCRVEKNLHHYKCQINMPTPIKIWQTSVERANSDIDEAIIFAQYEQFLHVVLKVKSFTAEVKGKAQQLAKLLAVALGEPLIGVLLFQENSAELAPLIYVPSLNSMVWERGCGSGTATIGAYLAWKNKQIIQEDIKQPGGTIQVLARYTEAQKEIKIKGAVEIVAQGKAYIEL
ncbi:diaminopimelate epimerase [Lysinibacillus sp. FSL H8-0500]|uniref:diaminopimelate epimerase n=1 Tax=Lysinibacillus sp. FSL H8-0500 TaxID=2921393 RepID=UPI0031014B5A